jgi:outer membrane protein OmpA-like peptidoglycan-associated protein
MYNHSLVTDESFTSGVVPTKLGFNLGLAAEIGVNLETLIKKKDEKPRSKNEPKKFSDWLRYRVGLFAEYGVLNVLKTSGLGENDIPPVLLKNPNPLELSYTSSLETSSASSAKLNPFLVGVKVTVFYELPRKQMKPMRMPSEPTPRIATRILHSETGEGLAGTRVTMTNETGKSTSSTTNSGGYVITRRARGEYGIVAEKPGFYSSDTLHYSHKRDLADTLIIRLRPEPKPIVYTLCGYAYAGDTRRPIPAAVRIGDAEDKKDLYEGETADDGLFVTELLAGQYVAHLRYPGYMPYDDTIHFEKDTLRFYLTKIKEGIRVKINNLFFATNKTHILPQSAQAMEELATFLSENEGVTIRITGHTDNVGSDEANQKLSEGRANAVKKDLIKRGIDPDRIETEGKGESEPVDTNDTEEGRQNNRRVEFTITSTNGADIQQIK